MATLVVRHAVASYAPWRRVYDEVQGLRAKHGLTGERVLQDAGDADTILVLHEFPTVGQAEAFATDPGLADAMARAGVAGPPRIEIYSEVD